MRVLVVIPNLGLGGTQQAMVYLLPALARRGVRCDVASMLEPHQIAPDLESAGIKVHRLTLRHRWSLPEASARLAWLVGQERYDVVHGKQYFASLYVAGLRPLFPRLCLVASFHNHEYDYPARRPLWLEARRQLQSWEMRRYIDAYGALSRATAEHYTRHLGIAPVSVLPNAIPTDRLRPRPELDRAQVLKRYGARPGEPVILLPNRLTHEKGHAVFLEALAMLRAQGLRPRALLLGKGPLLADLRAQVTALDLAEQVHLPGSEIPNPELVEVMAAADVVAVPSVFEAFGLVPAEAMAQGAAVVASATGGLLDLIEDERSGLLVPPKDPGALATALARLLADPALRAELGRGARARIESSFSVEAVAERFERFYQGALESARTRRGAWWRVEAS